MRISNALISLSALREYLPLITPPKSGRYRRPKWMIIGALKFHFKSDVLEAIRGASYLSYAMCYYLPNCFQLFEAFDCV